MDIQDIQNFLKDFRRDGDQLTGLLNVDALQKEMGDLDRQTADPAFWSNPQAAKQVGRRRSEIESRIKDTSSVQSSLADLDAFVQLISESPDDLRENAAEATRLVDTARRKIETLRHTVYFTDPISANNALLSINPGAGGVEAQDWADMLLRMYTRWADQHQFGVEMLDYQTADEAGIKDATLLVTGRHAFGLLRCERGVHRLVRISPFDANRRRHTSFASVYVIPEINEDITIEIRPEDLRVDTYRASGAGGQHVNKTDSAIRITHNPTGVVVTCQTERSQHKNRENAMRILKSKLYDLKEQEKQKELAALGGAKDSIGWGSQVRSYVLAPYQLIKDHRTDHETSNVNAMLDGEIDEFIESFLAWDAKNRSGT